MFSSAKFCFLMVSALSIHCAPVGMEENRQILMTKSSLSELALACQCDVEHHPLYQALRTSLTGNIGEFVNSNDACGFAGVDGKKGWLFISESCDQIKSLALTGFVR